MDQESHKQPSFANLRLLVLQEIDGASQYTSTNVAKFFFHIVYIYRLQEIELINVQVQVLM
jgi:hypothetical protein